MRTFIGAFAAAIILLMSASVTASASGHALTAAQVVAKVDSAIGDDDLTTEIETYSTTLDGKYATVTIMVKRPDRYYERIRIPQDQASTSMGILGSSVWIQEPDGKVTSADLGDSNVGADVISMLWSPETWLRFSLSDDRVYLGRMYHVLRVTSTATHKSLDVLIDPKTFYPATVQISSGGLTLNIEYRDFTSAPGGLIFPRHIAVIAPDGSTIHVFTITSLDANVPLDDSQFEAPQ